MNEHSFVQGVHRRLSAAVYRWKINARYANGVPDAYYSGPKGDVWVEYKWLPRTPRRHFKPAKKLSALQAKWLRDRSSEGRHVAVVVGSPAGAMIFEHHSWEYAAPSGQWIAHAEVARWIEQQTLSAST